MLSEIGDTRRQLKPSAARWLRMGSGFGATRRTDKRLEALYVGQRVKYMKQLSTLTNLVLATPALMLMAACQTVAISDAELAASRKEFLLAQSGFKVITVTTPKQQEAINGLAHYRVSAVKYQGKLYYVFPTANKDKIYVGKQKQFNTYKQALAGQQASSPTSMAQLGEQQMAGQSLEPALETAGPNHIQVQQFGGFGPMGVNALGDW